MNETGFTIDYSSLSQSIQQGDMRMLARTISLIENEAPGYPALLESMEINHPSIVVGVTGPPGSGKSTLVDGLIGHWVEKGKRVAVICVDPSSPFHFGALLGDRIRMSSWYNHPQVFIRSLATRGSLGGLHPRIIEITDLLHAARFDIIIVETVGVGQSEVEIAGLADTTVVVLVPEAGDDIQTMKAGLMEIADIFVINKCDRPDASQFIKYLQSIFEFSLPDNRREPAIVQTIASEKKGIDELAEKIIHHQQQKNPIHKINTLAEKAYQLIIQKKMKNIDKKELLKNIQQAIHKPAFNLYKFVSAY